MRIVGEIKHPVYKITLFKMDTRYSVKFEDRDLEQTYKFREGAIVQSLKDVYALMDKAFMDLVDQAFEQMRNASVQALAQAQERHLDEFDEII
ncbi:MAG TPA: hypothetical protein VJ953_08390 [Saprospiraceae bacterium]|nr:hypothetical protein [Saprospiraceae bacterium]